MLGIYFDDHGGAFPVEPHKVQDLLKKLLKVKQEDVALALTGYLSRPQQRLLTMELDQLQSMEAHLRSIEEEIQTQLN